MNDAEKKTPRVSRTARIEGLRRRGEFERDALAREILGLRGAVEAKRARWKTAGWIAGAGAVAWTLGRQFFGRHSLAARIGRLTSVAQVLFGVGKAVGKTRRFW